MPAAMPMVAPASGPLSAQVYSGVTFFDTPALELDAGLVHFLFVCVCMTIVVLRSSVTGFSARTQLMLWVSYLCSCFLRKLSASYWWTWGLVLAQTCVLLLFLPNLQRNGLLGEPAEKAVVLSSVGCAIVMGILYYQTVVAGEEQPKVGLFSQLGFMGGGDQLGEGVKAAMATANNESILRNAPGVVAFLVGFKRTLEALALLPQYRTCIFVQEYLDVRVYAWIFVVGLYTLVMTAFNFGKFHAITLVEGVGFVSFVVVAGSKVGAKAKEDESYTINRMDAELAEVNPLMFEDDFADIL